MIKLFTDPLTAQTVEPRKMKGVYVYSFSDLWVSHGFFEIRNLVGKRGPQNGLSGFFKILPSKFRQLQLRKAKKKKKIELIE